MKEWKQCSLKRKMYFIVFDGNLQDLQDFCMDFCEISSDGLIRVFNNNWDGQVCNIGDYIIKTDDGLIVADEALFLKYYEEV